MTVSQTVISRSFSISKISLVHQLRVLCLSFVISIFLLPVLLNVIVVGVQAASPVSDQTFTRTTLILHLGDQELDLKNSAVLLGNASASQPIVESDNYGFLLPIRMTLQTNSNASCFRILLNITQLQCSNKDSVVNNVTQLGLLIQPDESIHTLFSQMYPVAPPPQISRNVTSNRPTPIVAPTLTPITNTTTQSRSSCQRGHCPCDTTLEDAFTRLARKLAIAHCPQIQTVIVLPVSSLDPNNPDSSPSSDNGNTSDDNFNPDSFSRQVAVVTRQLVDQKEPGVSEDPQVIAVAPSPVADRLMATTIGPDMSKAAGLRFDLDIVDEGGTKKPWEEMDTAGCRISGWIFFAILILSMLITMIFTITLSCCFNLGFTISFCDLVIAWIVTITVAISFVIPRFIDPEMMLRLVAFLLDILVLISVIIRRACILARFHALCMSFVLGSLVLTVFISAIGSFVFGFRLVFLYRIPNLVLPSWTTSFSWALKGITIMSISLFTAFGIWCFHMVRHLVVRPQGKHRPYTEVSFLCGFGALSALLALLHDIIADSPELRAKEPLSLLACILLYLAHTLRCWALLLFSVWQPGTGTHRIRGRLPLPNPRVSYWQRISKRQLREMEEEERQRQMQQRDLEAQTDRDGNPSALNNNNATSPASAHNKAKSLGITAALIAMLARPFRRNQKPDTARQTPSSNQPRTVVPLTISTGRSSISSTSSGPSSPFTPPPAPLPFPPRRRRPSYWSPQELHPPPMARPMPIAESNPSSNPAPNATTEQTNNGNLDNDERHPVEATSTADVSNNPMQNSAANTANATATSTTAPTPSSSIAPLVHQRATTSQNP